MICMNEAVNERISVVMVFDRMKNSVMPHKLRWHGRDYLINRMTYHHKIRKGRVVYHVFHVTDGWLDFRLSFDTDSLQWVLEEVYDGRLAH